MSRLRIEIVHVGAGDPVHRTYTLDAPASVAAALCLAAEDPAFAGVNFERAAVGVYGVLVAPSTALADGDRIEIYRGPAVDPKAARRERAAGARRLSRRGRS